jgi:hypothetical protein
MLMMMNEKCERFLLCDPFVSGIKKMAQMAGQVLQGAGEADTTARSNQSRVAIAMMPTWYCHLSWRQMTPLLMYLSCFLCEIKNKKPAQSGRQMVVLVLTDDDHWALGVFGPPPPGSLPNRRKKEEKMSCSPLQNGSRAIALGNPFRKCVGTVEPAPTCVCVFFRPLNRKSKKTFSPVPSSCLFFEEKKASRVTNDPR